MLAAPPMPHGAPLSLPLHCHLHHLHLYLQAIRPQIHLAP
jgi:hypothetical protein